jgi:hypothetical protein
MLWRSLFGRKVGRQVAPAKEAPAEIRESRIGAWLKNASVLVALVISLIAEAIATKGGYLWAIYVVVAAGFAVAVLLLALSAIAWKGWGCELRPRLGLAFILCGPTALAAASSLAIIHYYVTERGHYIYCEDPDNCLTLGTAIRFSDRFVLYLVVVLAFLDLVILIAAGFVRLLERSSRERISDKISSERKGSRERDPER